MPNESIIRDLVRLKLKAAEHVVQCLPPHLKEHAQENLHKAVLACHEAAGEFLEQEKHKEAEEGLTKIVIE